MLCHVNGMTAISKDRLNPIFNKKKPRKEDIYRVKKIYVV